MRARIRMEKIRRMTRIKRRVEPLTTTNINNNISSYTKCETVTLIRCHQTKDGCTHGKWFSLDASEFQPQER